MPYCPNCGREVRSGESFCPYCGQKLAQGTGQDQYRATQQDGLVSDQYAEREDQYQGHTGPGGPPYPSFTPPKSPGVAALLALLPGFIGLFGIGHIYVGKIVKGIILLLVGLIVVPFITLGVVFGLLAFGPGGLGGGIALIVVLGIVWIVIWIWQTFDAYRLANEYNAHVQRTGVPPW